MGYTLPWDGDRWEDELALQFSMREIDLKTDWPRCYLPQLTATEKQDENGTTVTETIITGIKGWAPGYEDGGPLVEERVFLFLYFDDAYRKSVKLRVPKRAGTKIKFTRADIASGNVPIDWVPAAYLRPVEADVGSTVRGRLTARKFNRMLRELGSIRRRGLDGPSCHSHSTSEGMDDSRASWDESASVAGDDSSISLQVDRHREVTPRTENETINVSTRGARDDQDGQADVGSQARLPHQMELDEHHDDHLFKTPMISSRLRRLSSNKGDDSHSDEGVIMDYDLEVEQSVSVKGGLAKETAFNYEPSQERGEVPSNEGR